MKIKHLALFIILIFSFKISSAQILYQESFESGFGIWTNLTSPTDQFDWQINSGTTPTSGTGPDAASDGTYYAFIEANEHLTESAIIEGSFNLSGTTQPIISFDYHMYGTGIGTLSLWIYNGTSWTEIWNNFENLGNQWNNTKVCLANFGTDSTNVRLRFQAQPQYSDSSDIAIDNIEISDFKYTSVTKSDVTCGGYSNGSITINISGGYGPYEYSVDDGVTYYPSASQTFSITNIPGGDYPILVKDASVCDIRYPVVTLEEPQLTDITNTKSDVLPCVYSQNGQIKISASGNYSPFEYSINGFGGPFYTDSVFNGLDTGTYTIAVKNSNGCITVGNNVSINAPGEIFIMDYSSTNVSTCNGSCNGSLTIVTAGGNSSIEYSVDNVLFQSSGYFSDLCAGNYRVYIRDSEGCLDTTAYTTIGQPSKVHFTSITKTHVSDCYGDSTGTITLEAAGGTGQLTYSIDNGYVYFNQNIFTGLPANTYHVWVRDENNCKADSNNIIILQPDLLVLDSVTSQNVIGCYGNGNGEIHFYAHGGTGAINYSIDNGTTLTTNSNFLPLDVGTYYPYIEDQNGCSETSSPITLTQPQQLVINNVNSYDVDDCYGSTSGIIQIFAAYGTEPYQYSIDTGTTFQSNFSFDNLPAGEYKVAVKDASGCTVIGQNVTINQPTQIIITDEIVTNVSCYGSSDGAIFVDATGGTGDLRYSIDGGTSYPYYTGAYAYKGIGTYTIRVRDENGCIINGSVLTITQPDSLALDSVVVTNVQGCYGDSTGVIKIYAHGGAGPIEYSIDNGLTRQLDYVFDTLVAKTGYLPYIIDANGCYVIGDQQTIGQPSSLLVTSQAHTNIDTCYGVPVGTITVTSTGGTGTVSYSIDNGNTFYNNGGIFTGLSAGVYNIKIKDINNCPANGWEETIYQPDSLILDSIAVKDVICYGQSNGQLYIYAHGGQPQLKYYINSSPPYTSSQVYNLNAGQYIVKVEDKYKCTVIDTVILNQPNEMFLDDVTFDDVSTCYGESTGSITVSAHGGVPELIYTYTNLGGATSAPQTDSVFNNVPAGSYYVIVKDQNGCSLSSTAFTIHQPQPISITSYDVTSISCFGLNDGEISVSASGGVGQYEYSIDDGVNWQPDSIFTGLIEGTYDITVRDSNLCQILYPFTVNINEPTQLIIYDIQEYSPSCYGYTNGKIVVTAYGGTSTTSNPFIYTLNDSIVQTTSTFNNLTEGQYWLTVTDNNNCVAQSDTITLIMPENLALFSTDVVAGCSPLTVNFTRDSTLATFLWAFGDGSISHTQDPTYTYENQTDAPIVFKAEAVAEHSSCTDTASINITVYQQPIINFELDTSIHYYPDTIVNINNINTSLTNYLWNFGDSTSYSGEQPINHSYPNCGVYNITLTAENAYNCPDTSVVSVMITGVEPQTGYIPSIDKGCSPLIVEFINTTTNANEYEWYVSGDLVSTDTNLTYTFEESLNYLVELRATGYCGKTGSYNKTIYSFGHPDVMFEVLNDTVAVMQNVAFENYTTDASYYIWDFGDGEMTGQENPDPHQYAEPGYYDVLLKAYSPNGCVDSMLIENAVYVSSEFYFKFPTAFSPDNDGLNDYFVPKYNMVDNCSVEVYTRRGQIIFRTDDFENTFWDGKRNGKDVPIDTYVWRASGQYKSGIYFTEFGEVTVIR